MKVLIIGGGGREHAIAYKLSMSSRVSKLFCIPGNAGISEIAECAPQIGVMDFDKIVGFIEQNQIDFTVVAPENPLAGGLCDLLRSKGHAVFGPSSAAAKIEASKVYSKTLMKKYGIPTADFEVFTDEESAIKYLNGCKYPTVIKADGLALGKGVVVAANRDEAVQAVKDMMGGMFGDSGKQLIIEKFIKGFEVSVLAFTDGKTVVPMVSSQDHKRALDGNKGANTGGMGAISPSPYYTKKMELDAYKNIIVPTIKALEKEGTPFSGVLYYGLMVSDGGAINVIEYNARFGDPEAQAVLLRLETDLLDIMEACSNGRLADIDIKFSEEASACIVLASGGYPQKYQTGKKIILDDIPRNIVVFHAGTKIERDTLVTAGGRVLGVSCRAKDVKTACKLCYKAIRGIRFDFMHYRTDIGR